MSTFHRWYTFTYTFTPRFDENLSDFPSISLNVPCQDANTINRREAFVSGMSNFLILKRIRDMHMRTRARGYRSACNWKSQIFLESISTCKRRRAFCIWQPGHTISGPALDKTIVSTGNLGLCFNLKKKHRERHWLRCAVILVFIASRDCWKCQLKGWELYVHPRCYGYPGQTSATRIIHAITYNLEKSKSVRTRFDKKKGHPAQYSSCSPKRLIYRLHET